MITKVVSREVTFDRTLVVVFANLDLIKLTKEFGLTNGNQVK